MHTINGQRTYLLWWSKATFNHLCTHNVCITVQFGVCTFLTWNHTKWPRLLPICHFGFGGPIQAFDFVFHTVDHLALQGLWLPYFRGIGQKSIWPNNRFVPYFHFFFERIVGCLCYNHVCLCVVLSLHLISLVIQIKLLELHAYFKRSVWPWIVHGQTTKTGLTPFETFSLMNSDILLHHLASQGLCPP
jgi:hypothetical protein